VSHRTQKGELTELLLCLRFRPASQYFFISWLTDCSRVRASCINS
jgi:hypothetical protein